MKAVASGLFLAIISKISTCAATALLCLAVTFPAAAADCLTPPAGLIGWWTGNGTTNDDAGTNNGVLMGGVTYDGGEVGQGFSFNGNSQSVLIPYSPSLIRSNFSVEAWVKPASQVSDGVNQDLIFGQNVGAFSLVARPGTSGVRIAFQIGVNGMSFYDVVSTNQIPIGQFSHLAGTWNGGTLRLYVNGVLHAQRTPGAQPTDSGCALSIGGLGLGPNAGWYVGQFFNGVIDEVSYYSRVLSGAEIANLYSAGTAGKCVPLRAPIIQMHPHNVTVNVGETATFSVMAAGPAPLEYQWHLNGGELAGATTSVLALDNVQPTNAGTYHVVVSNPYGSTNSGGATLTVVVPPPCTPAPAGLVSWWRGDGNSNDGVGSNNAVLMGGATFAAGQVGQGFSLNGNSQDVLIPYSPSLITSNYSVEAWVKPASQVSDPIGQDFIFGQNYGGCQLLARTGTSGVRIVMQFATSHVSFSSVSSTVQIPIGQFSHIVGTWDGASLRLYINGVLNAQQTFGVRPVDSGCAFSIGGLGLGPNACDYVGQFFNGVIDEPSYYGRALTGAQIANLYSAAGKCEGVPPSILTQPSDQAVAAGQNASFSVLAAGASPLSYQWRFNSAPRPGATASALAFSAASTDAGTYDVIVTNLYGSITSAPATLMVLAPGICLPPPTG